MRTADINKPYTTAFCRDFIKIDVAPIYVGCDPATHAGHDDCFLAVNRHVESHGGNRVLGWAIWEWPNVFIEAEFHAVWESPTGELVDINRRELPVTKILFIKDECRAYEEFQIDRIRLALNSDPTIEHLFRNRTAWFNAINKGELKYKHGRIEPTPEITRLSQEHQRIEMELLHRYGRYLTPEAR